jgi:hypothetical protein
MFRAPASREDAVHTFEFHITDDRYATPTLKLVLAANKDGARDEAQRTLNNSAHHRGVAVYLNAERLFGLDALADAPGAAAAPGSPEAPSEPAERDAASPMGDRSNPGPP